MSVRDLIIFGCSTQQPTRFRNHSGYLVRWNNEGFLIDPGEGTQRQFIFANVAPTCVTRILISHFHGDHCLGLGSMLMRLNLDKVQHEIHCYFPASGKKYFDRLRYCSIYHDRVNVVEHPVSQYGIVDDFNEFIIEAFPLEHSVENIGWKISEKPKRRYDKQMLDSRKIKGAMIKDLIRNNYININNQITHIDEVSYIQDGDIFGYVSDSRYCDGALETAYGSKILLCESTYMHKEKQLAYNHYHMTACQAAKIARKSNVKKLVLTHFSARYSDLRPMLAEARKLFSNTILAEDLKSIPFER